MGLDGSCWSTRNAKNSANTGTSVEDDPVDKGIHELDLCITTSPMPAPFLGKPDSHEHMASLQCFSQHVWIAQLKFPLFHQDLCWGPSPFESDHPYQQGPRYPIFHPQYPRRAEEHVDALHKATIRDPLVEMNYNLQMIKTQLMVERRYSRLCKGAVQMRSYQDLRSILG